RLPGAVSRAGADVWFSPGYTAPLRLRCPSVVTIHDVSFYAHPEWFSWREGLRRRWLTRASAHRAAAIVTVSEFSADEIVRWLDVPRTRVHVAYHGVSAPVGASHPSEAPIVLFVGSIFNCRHVPELLRGFAAVQARLPDARLVL